MKKNNIFFASAFILAFAFNSHAQEGRVQISQDTLIPQLLDLKTKLSKESRLGDRYKIQIFSGDYEKATKVKKEYDQLYTEWPATREYETPNYKVWVGSFRNSVEADRALTEIKKTFPSAFRFKPDRN